MKYHEICDLFPAMSDDEFDALVEDIRRCGVMQPIWTWKGQVIDGKHRHKACQKLKIKCPADEWDGKGSMVEFVTSQNLKRRHLSASQKAMIAVEMLPMLEAEAKERQKAALKVGDKYRCPVCQELFAAPVWHCPECAHHYHIEDDDCHNCRTPRPDTVLFPDPPIVAERGDSRDKAAAAMDVSHGYVSDAKKLVDESPELAERVKAGEMTIPQAKREAAQGKADSKRKKAAAGSTLDKGIIIGDFREKMDAIPDGSLSLIFTDPPYDKKAVKLFDGLGQLAASKLAEGGSLVCYVGHIQIPTVLPMLENHLRFWWICCCLHSDKTTVMQHYGIRPCWKPMLWFVKGTRLDTQRVVKDVVSGGREKDAHDWQQAESEAAYWIEHLCPEDGMVCDPFIGGGTTAVAAKRLGRQWVGFEVDKQTAMIASKRIKG